MLIVKENIINTTALKRNALKKKQLSHNVQIV